MKENSKLFYKLFKNNIFLLILILILMIFTTLNAIISSSIFVSVLDIISNKNSWNKLMLYSLFYIIIAIAQDLIFFLHSLASEKLSNKIIRDIKCTVINNLFFKDESFFTANASGDLMETLEGDTQSLLRVVTEIFLKTLTSSFTVIGMVIYLGYLNIELLFIILLFQPISLCIQIIWKKIIYKHSEKSRKVSGIYFSNVQDFFSNIITYVSMGLRKFHINRFKKVLDDDLNNQFRLSGRTILSSISINALHTLTFVAIILVGGRKVIGETMTIGALIAFIQLVPRILQPILQIWQTKTNLATLRPSLERLQPLLSHPKVAGDKLLEETVSSITFDNITFKYNEIEVLTEMSMSFISGKTYAIMGKSGIGKSTILKLVLRLVEPTHGNVRINEIDISRYDTENLRNKITYLSQNAFIINDTVRNNLQIGTNNIDDEDIYEALTLVNLTQVVNDMPLKLDTLIGEKGSTISGGQAKRFALARTFLQHNPIILLDEPTSGLDTKTAKFVLKNIKSIFKENCIVIIISHEEFIKEYVDETYFLV